MYKDSSESLVKGLSSNCYISCILNICELHCPKQYWKLCTITAISKQISIFWSNYKYLNINYNKTPLMTMSLNIPTNISFSKLQGISMYRVWTKSVFALRYGQNKKHILKVPNTLTDWDIHTPPPHTHTHTMHALPCSHKVFPNGRHNKWNSVKMKIFKYCPTDALVYVQSNRLLH